MRPRRVVDGRSVLLPDRLLRGAGSCLLLGIVGDEAAAMEERVGGGGGRRAERVVALPCEGRAEEGERLAGAGGRLEERVGAALAAGAVERGDDAAHEGQLRPVGLVGELHRHAAHLVHAAAATRGCGCGRGRGPRRGEVVGGGGHGGGRNWAGGIGGK